MLDTVLAADCNDVGANDSLRAVYEQGGKVFTVGQADQQVQDAGARIAVGK